MGADYFTNPVVFLIRIFFELYILAVMLRFLLQWVRADFYNPLSQFIVKATNTPLKPLRRILPGYGGIDFASIFLALLLTAIKLTLIISLQGYGLQWTTILIFAIADLVKLFLNIFFWSIIIGIVLSWVAPHQYNPVSILTNQLNTPLLQPIRRILPAFGGLDFSPFFAILIIQLSKMIILPPIYALAQ